MSTPNTPDHDFCYPLTPEFIVPDFSSDEETNQNSPATRPASPQFTPTRYPLFLYVSINSNIILCLFVQFALLPDLSLVFSLIHAFPGNDTFHIDIVHPTHILPTHPHYEEIYHFIFSSNEEFLEGEFNFSEWETMGKYLLTL